MNALAIMVVVNKCVLIQMEASIALVILVTMEVFSAQVDYYFAKHFSSVFTDIDECQLGTDNCTQQCNNTDGSYLCSCNGGFILDNDSYSCIG